MVRKSIVGVSLVLSVVTAPSAQTLAPLQPTDAKGRVTYFIAEGAPGSQYRPPDRELAEWALATWTRAVGGALRLERTSEDEALVRVYWVSAQEGQYGEMRPLMVNGRRGAAVYVRPDMSALGPDIARLAGDDPLMRDAIVYLTCVHELGHAFGLTHSTYYDDIMYFFGYGGDVPHFFGRYRKQLKGRADIKTRSGLSDADEQRARRIYATR